MSPTLQFNSNCVPYLLAPGLAEVLAVLLVAQCLGQDSVDQLLRYLRPKPASVRGKWRAGWTGGGVRGLTSARIAA